jgi:molybdopterin-binding protein
MARHREDNLTVITLDSGEIVYSTDSASGPVGVVVYPWEVLVGHAHAADSALNVIEGDIRSIVHVGNRARIRIGPLTAEVTDTSVEKLGLAVGGRAVASFKATGTRLVSYG